MTAEMTMTKRYECLEPDCGYVAEADSEDALVEQVREHMASAHNTFELDEVILANATTVEGSRSG